MSFSKRRVMKVRRAWWLETGLVIMGIIAFVVGAAMTLIIHFVFEWTYASPAFAFFWLTIMAAVFLALRQSSPEPVNVIDKKEMSVIKDEIRAGRIKVRKDLADMERSLLEQGARAPVLDAWRLDPTYASLHALVSYVDTSEVDPLNRELLLRLQLDELDTRTTSVATLERNLLQDVASLLWMAARDPYYLNIRRFVETVVVEVYSTREDEHHVDVPFPIMSLLLSCKALSSLRADAGALKSVAEVRVNGGAEVDPHRGIPPTRMARGAK